MVGTLRRLLVSSSRNLQLASATSYGPTALVSAKITTVSATSTITRHPFVVGSGDVSQIVLSFFAWYLQKLVGVTVLGNGFSVDLCAIEYNGVSQPVTFSGGRTLAVASGDTDIQSDGLSASAFGVASFSQGAIGYVRLKCSFGAAQTDKLPLNSYVNLSDNQLLYDPLKCSITNGVDSTGPITYSMTNGGVFGTDAVSSSLFFTPIVLGRFVATGVLPTFVIAGDSIAAGALDTTSNLVAAKGYSRFLFPNGVSSGSGALACLNFSCAGGIGSDWANGSPSKLLVYLKYAKYAMEAYGANAGNVSYSTAIHAQFRSAGIASIHRVSITPSTSSSDSWTTAVGQSYAANYGPGSGFETFDSSLKALVASDYSYLDPIGMRDQSGAGDYWKWFTNGTNFYAVHSDGLHPTSGGYELQATGTTNITAAGGSSSNSLRALFASLT